MFQSGINPLFFLLRILIILTHTHGEMGKDLKETDSGVYPKWPNSWIYSTDFKVMFGNSFCFLFSKTCFLEYKEKTIFLYF